MPVVSFAIASALLAAAPLAARSADPQFSPPAIELLEAPADPIAYFEAKERLRALIWQRIGSEAEIEPIAEALAREYPHDGENWDLLARLKSRLGKHEEAAQAWERAGPLIGWGMTRSPGFNAAQMYARLGDERRALDLIRSQLEEIRSPLRLEMFEWDEFESLRNDPEFRDLAGRPDTAGWNRVDGWRGDLAHLVAEVRRVNPDYHSAPLPPQFTALERELHEQVPHLSDEEIFVGMNRMLATLRQGHTGLSGFPAAHPSGKRLPVRFYVFPEGLFIVATAEGYQDLIGSRVLAFGDASAEEALRRVYATQSTESDMLYLYTGPGRLRNMAYLRGLGIAGEGDVVQVVIERPDGSVDRVALAAGTDPVTPDFNLLPAPPGVPPPLFLSNQQEKHWHVLLPEHDAIYVQLYNVHNEPDETLPEYGRRLRTVLADANPANLILDLRHNTGGVTGLYPELLRTLIGFSQSAGKQVYVINGRATYSAAANLITDLERLAAPIFVGEPSSQCCNFAGDPSPVMLPYSRIGGVVSAVRWNLSGNVFDGRSEISPHVPVQLGARAYFEGRDPVLETVIELIRRQ